MTTTTLHDHHHDGTTHTHPHDHDNGPAAGSVVVESSQHHGPSHDGSVVLDIGGAVGAAVLHVPAELAGVEIDIDGLSPGTTSTHSLVRPRVMPEGTYYAAVYPGLPQGSYRFAATAGHPATAIEVRGGKVSEADWRC